MSLPGRRTRVMYVSGCCASMPPAASRTWPRTTSLSDHADRSRNARTASRTCWTCMTGASGSPCSTTPGCATSCAPRRRIAVIGASNDPTRPSNGVLPGPALRRLRRRAGQSQRRPPSTASSATRIWRPRSPRRGPSTSSMSSVAPDQCLAMLARRSRPARGCLWLQLGIANCGGGTDRPRGWPRGRDGPLHDHRALRSWTLARARPDPAGAALLRATPSVPPPGVMTQIHLHAEPGDYAPVVLLPGDPNRATRMAARFDGGLEATRLVNANRGLLGYTGTLDGVPVSVQTTMMGTPTTTIVDGGAAQPRRDDVHPGRDVRRVRRARDRATSSWPWPRPRCRASATSWAAASRPPRRADIEVVQALARGEPGGRA